LENNSKLAIVTGASSGRLCYFFSIIKIRYKSSSWSKAYGHITRDKRANCQSGKGRRGEGEIFLERKLDVTSKLFL